MQTFTGLTTSEAAILLKKYGQNEIKDFSRSSPFKILLRQIQGNFLIYLLSAAALISFFVSEPITALVIIATVILTIGLGFIQEYRAEVALNALKQMITPTSLVLRSGKQIQEPSNKLVPGDLILLRTGEKVPADCLILEENDLSLDESMLTGESNPVRKKASSKGQDQDEYKIYMGTFIVSGRAIARVIQTGMDTKFGHIAEMISTADKTLPLEGEITQITKYMSIIAITASVLTGFFILSQLDALSYPSIVSILILVISLAVAAFPEGFPLVLTVTLASGAATLARKNAIVNRLSVIETLGETTIICADKTGTITKGEMTAKAIFLNSKTYTISGSGYQKDGQFLLNDKFVSPPHISGLDILLKVSLSCNDSMIEPDETSGEFKLIGSPTEGALLVLASKANYFKEDLLLTRQEEIPFNSSRKMMSVLTYDKHSNFEVFAKGAPEVILEHCSRILFDGKVIPLNKAYKDKIISANQSFNSNSYRTISLAYKPVEKKTKKYNEDDLIFLGLVSLEDPPREEVASAIQTCLNAGIKVIMITGDHKDTAISIGKQIGLTGKVLDGAELDKMFDSDLIKVISEVSIFARVRPEHKLRIIKLLKDQGEIVAMTGDGVNDAPALKEAHIGIAMGVGGTDVSRSVADITLKDNNFATIVSAIKEGRTIFANIRKFISYQLSCSLAELAILLVGVILAPIFGWQLPILLALQILFMNLVTDNLPAITLGFNPSSPDIMQIKPRTKSQLLTKSLIILILFNSFLMALFTLISYTISFNLFHQSSEFSRTASLLTLILLEISTAFVFRSFRQRVLTRSPFTNKWLFMASALSLIATILILYTSANQIFETIPLPLQSWLIPVCLSLVIIIIYDLLKSLPERYATIAKLH